VPLQSLKHYQNL